MSNRKNYNSIVFLTTLSVYLGLVLVGGATPSVLAQAATTRDFNIKNEIVVEDDLDKKPDDDIIKLSGATGGYFDDNNRWICSTLITRFRPDGKGFGLKGTETGTIEVITPTTNASSNTTGLPLWPGTAPADIKNSSTVVR